jgi:hypothetical protein
VAKMENVVFVCPFTFGPVTVLSKASMAAW